jgi:predicted TIM-barrel fold metal-dependent hydrolase
VSLKVFDTHVHLGKWGSHIVHEKKISPLAGHEIDSFSKLIAYMEKSQIERVVAIPMYLPDQEQTYRINSLVIECAKRAPEKIVPGLWVNPSKETQDCLYNTLEMARVNNVHVLKTTAETWGADYSPDPVTWDSTFTESMTMILNYAKNTESVIQIHTGSGKSDIRLIEKLIRFAGPKVIFHLVHMGNTTGGHFYLVARLKEWLEEGLSIVCDTALARGFAVRWLFESAKDNPILCKSMLFASDEPWGVFQSELVKVIDAARGDLDLLDAVVWKNATRIYSK